MKRDKVYGELLKLKPWHNTGIDFRHTLKEVLNGYNRILSELDKQDCPNDWNNITKKTCKEINKLKDIQYFGKK